MSQMSPEQAHQHLDTAHALMSGTQQIARKDAYVGAITTAGVGSLIAAVLALSWAFAPHHKIAFVLSFAAYGISLGLLIAWQRTHQRVFQRGFSRAYLRSFVATMVLYAFGIIWLIRHANWMVIAPYCVLVAMPMLVAALKLSRAGRR